jgi:hypothetical protein
MSKTIYNEILPTTMIDGCITANFRGENEVNLCITKNNYLEIYGISQEVINKNLIFSDQKINFT